jgi:hypothetical protein
MSTRLSTDSGARLAGLALRLRALSVGLAVASAGCVDTHQALQDFTDRVVDAGNNDIDAPPIDELPDVTGQFLFGLTPQFALGVQVRFIADFELAISGAVGMLDISLQPITVDEGTPVGDPLLSPDVAVAENGTFDAPLAGEVDGDANPASGSDLTFEAILHGQLRTADLVCGTVDGMVTQPVILALDGSTFGAIRITAGTIGDALPPPVSTCPGGSSGDAGVEDGFDAGPPDAAP